jgi:hypothetical protein
MYYKPPIFFILLSSIFNFTLAQEVTLTFDCPEEVVAGSEGNILTINLENDIYLDGFELKLDLGSTEIELIDVINGNVLPSWNTTSFVLDSTYLNIITFNFSGGLIDPGNGTLFHIEYNAPPNDSEFNVSIIDASTFESPGFEIFENIDFSDTCTISVVEPQEELEVYLGFGEIDPIENTVEIIMNVNDPPGYDGVTGFQFTLNGGIINDALWGNEWGYLGDYFIMISASDSIVIAFGDFNVQGREGVAFTLEFDEFIENELCITDVLMSNTTGQSIENIEVDDCVSISQYCTVPGDVNNDQIVNVLDILSIICIWECNYECTDSADVNEDGTVNILDIVMMVNIILEE